jgi:DNA-binding MarR family transcriptional regulator
MIAAEIIVAEIVGKTNIVPTTFICDNGQAMNEQATATRHEEETSPEPVAGHTPHGDAWGALTRTHAAIVGRLQEALSSADFPPLPWYEVLATLAEAPDERMKMGDLAEAMVITRGGLTKLVDRLVKAGLLERTFCETDRRVSYATLLPAGRDLLAEMRPVVVAELRVSFSEKLSVEEAEELRSSLERVRASACDIS